MKMTAATSYYLFTFCSSLSGRKKETGNKFKIDTKYHHNHSDYHSVSTTKDSSIHLFFLIIPLTWTTTTIQSRLLFFKFMLLTTVFIPIYTWLLLLYTTEVNNRAFLSHDGTGGPSFSFSAFCCIKYIFLVFLSCSYVVRADVLSRSGRARGLCFDTRPDRHPAHENSESRMEKTEDSDSFFVWFQQQRMKRQRGRHRRLFPSSYL